MKKRRNKKNSTALAVVMALAIAGASGTTLMVHATNESCFTTTEAKTVSETEVGMDEVAAETTTTTSITTEITTTTTSEVNSMDKPRVGDKIWINEEKIIFWDADKSYKSEVTSKIQFDIYIIGLYDDEHFRVHVPYMNEPYRVLLIPVDCDITVVERDGKHTLGDLTKDGRVDAFDMILLRQAMFRDFDLENYSDIDALMERSWDRQLADVNSDKEVSVADLVCMQNFLLGRTKSFRE